MTTRTPKNLTRRSQKDPTIVAWHVIVIAPDSGVV